LAWPNMIDVHALLDDVLSCCSTELQDVEDALSIDGQCVNSTPQSLTTLMHAVQEQNVELVSQLLRSNADPNIGDSKGVTPLHVAAFVGNYDIQQSLIMSSANANAQDKHGQTPLFFAHGREVCQQLSVAGANLHALNRKGQSPLHLAAYAGLDNVVSWLVANMKQGVINQQDKHGRTAVYCALKNQKLSTVTILHEHGADLTLQPSKYSATSTPGRGRPTTADRRRRRPASAAQVVVGSSSASTSASLRPESAPFKTEASAPCRSEDAWKDGSLEVVPGSVDWMSRALPSS